MKKIRLLLSSLMISAMVILPASVSAQAEEIANVNTNDSTISAVALAVPSGFTKKATINANNVNLRNSSWVSLGQMQKGDTVYLDFTDVRIWNGNVMVHCYSVRHGLIGYVCQSYYDLN